MPLFEEQEILQRLQDELQRLQEALRARLYLPPEYPSQWSGEVALSDNPEALGMFRGRIEIRPDIADDPARWRTLIHELLHAHSRGNDRYTYERLKGWEEAPVEVLQRCLRKQILEDIGELVEESVFEKAEDNWKFEAYIPAVERLREALGEQDLVVFYREMLMIPLEERPGYLLSRLRRMTREERREFVQILSESSSILKTNLR